MQIFPIPHDMPDDLPLQIGDQIVPAGQYRQQLDEQLQTVQKALASSRNEWVRHRAQSGVEDRWRRASAMYEGRDTQEGWFVETLKTGPSPKTKRAEQTRSRVVVNIVRPKVDQAVARLCEILLPVDDQNWAIRPTPVAETVQQMLGNHAPTVIPGTNTPTGMTAHDEATAVMQAARDAAKGMEKAIADPLEECGYNGEQRKGIEDGVRLGTMVLWGPYPKRITQKVWQPGADGAQQMIYQEKIIPASCRVDPWDIWFDPSCGADHQAGAGVWRRRFLTRKQLRELAKMKMGYNPDAIRQVLQLKPNRVTVAEGRVQYRQAEDQSYELWEYHGEIEPDDMLLMSLNTNDPLTDVARGSILMVNDIVIGAMPSWIEDGTLPCDVWNWRKNDTSPYGFGLPHELEHQQRVVTAAWRQVMDNARFAVGSQVVYRGGLIPIDGTYEIFPGKQWRADPDKIDDVTKAFEVYDFPSHLQELLAIADKAMQYADQESSMPQLLGGERGTAPETVGGMVMLYNTANAVLRMRVKLYDDGITRPHITRHFDWHMRNNPDPNIKGDMQTDARGSTALLEKDIQNQATLNLANITNNPRYQPFLDPEKELDVMLKAFRLQPEDVKATPEQIKQNQESAAQAQPEEPRVAAARIMAGARAASDQVTRERAQMVAQTAAMKEDAETQRFNAEIAAKMATGSGI